MISLSIALIGEGKMARDCLKAILETESLDVCCVITPVGRDTASQRLLKLCADYSIEVPLDPDPNSDQVLSRLAELRPDVILNINSFYILKEAILGIAPEGIINFHNGPLPLYAGVNIPTWVIWNGERSHGVTWHYVDSGIDTGDVILQRNFSLDGRETAASLTFKCILEGTALFGQLLECLEKRAVPRLKQIGIRTYFSRSQIPNDGYINFTWPSKKIDRLLRSLNFHPFPNTLVYPRIRLRDSQISIAAASCEMHASRHKRVPGKICAVDMDRVTIDTIDGTLFLRQVINPDGKTLGPLEAAEQYGLRAGDRLI
jgi:methionyl-tRNA formyltransferase